MGKLEDDKLQNIAILSVEVSDTERVPLTSLINALEQFDGTIVSEAFWVRTFLDADTELFDDSEEEDMS